MQSEHYRHKMVSLMKSHFLCKYKTRNAKLTKCFSWFKIWAENPTLREHEAQRDESSGICQVDHTIYHTRAPESDDIFDVMMLTKVGFHNTRKRKNPKRQYENPKRKIQFDWHISMFLSIWTPLKKFPFKIWETY